MTRKHVLIVANPAAGSPGAKRLRLMIDGLKRHGCVLDVVETRAKGDAERIAAEVDSRTIDAIAAAGGDGTINEVLNGLTENAPPLAILPLGTVNVLAREIGLSRSIDDIVETVVYGPSRRISIGEANGRRFAMMASVGLDAAVVERVDLKLKRQFGRLAYLYETAKQILFSSPITFHARTEDGDRQAGGIIIANGRHYGGRYIAAPAAHLERPSLEVCHLTGSGRLAAPAYLLSMFLGRLARRDDYEIREETSIDILGPIGAPLQADGDLLCRLPARIRILPAAVELIFPARTPALLTPGADPDMVS